MLATDYLDRSSDWGALESAAGIGAWRSSPYRLGAGGADASRPVEGPPWPEGRGGADDSHFVTLAENLVNVGEGNAYLRLGWEFNGTWYKWRVKNAKGGRPLRRVLQEHCDLDAVGAW